MHQVGSIYKITISLVHLLYRLTRVDSAMETTFIAPRKSYSD